MCTRIRFIFRNYEGPQEIADPAHSSGECDSNVPGNLSQGLPIFLGGRSSTRNPIHKGIFSYIGPFPRTPDFPFMIYPAQIGWPF
jgi:hypothetical protein